MKWIFTLTVLIFTVAMNAQIVIDFENFQLPLDTFDNGSDGSGGFIAEPLFFNNTYVPDPNFPFWSGWSISTKRDTLTRGFTNQYSAFTDEGFDSSSTYGVSFGGTNVLEITDSIARTIDGIYVTNSTYAYYSILEGDSFADAFGGESGNEKDVFLLTIKKYLDGELSTDSIDFYLADYRFDDNSMDYIINEWTYVDLSNLGPVDSLQFKLTTTVENDFGPATPFYFCLDNVIIQEEVTSIHNDNLNSSIRVYPNPVIDQLFIDWTKDKSETAQLFDATGRILSSIKVQFGTNEVDLSSLPAGQYWLKVGNLHRPILKAR